MAFITASTLTSAVAARLGKASNADLRSGIDDIITDCVEDAYQEIVTVLTDRGYTTTQIANWDRGAEFNRKIGVCLVLENEGVNHEVDEQRLDRICKCREELLTVPIIVDGVLVEPTGAGAGFGHGAMDTGTDTFVFDDMEL